MNTTTANTEKQATPVTVTNVQDYGAALQEVAQAAWFIADTATLIEGHQDWDGTKGNPSPYYLTQLIQLVRQAASKQLSLVELMEDLVSEPAPSETPLLDVMELPRLSQAGKR